MGPGAGDCSASARSLVMIGTGWAAAAPEGPGAALLGIRHVADSTGTLAMKKVKRSKALLTGFLLGLCSSATHLHHTVKEDGPSKMQRNEWAVC